MKVAMPLALGEGSGSKKNPKFAVTISSIN